MTASGFYWLASYPKSGNTWMRLALSSVQAGGAAVHTADKVAYGMPWSRAVFDRTLEIDSSDLTHDECDRLKPRALELMSRRASAPQICKVHDAWHDTTAGEPVFPPAVTLGAIYMVRDPRDVAVWYAAFMGQTLDATIAVMASPAASLAYATDRLNTHLRQRLGSWSAHVEGWLDAPVRVLLIRYEDMLADPGSTITQAAAFMGWTPSPAAIEASVQTTRFSRLQEMEQQTGFREKIGSASRFFRQGQAGGWRDALTPAQADAIVRTHEKAMKRLGYLADS